jgi:hypothetical protein
MAKMVTLIGKTNTITISSPRQNKDNELEAIQTSKAKSFGLKQALNTR